MFNSNKGLYEIVLLLPQGHRLNGLIVTRGVLKSAKLNTSTRPNLGLIVTRGCIEIKCGFGAKRFAGLIVTRGCIEIQPNANIQLCG